MGRFSDWFSENLLSPSKPKNHTPSVDLSRGPNGMRTHTLAHGGGTFFPGSEDNAEITKGYSVGLHKGTYRKVHKDDEAGFDKAVDETRRKYPKANLGTWMDDDYIDIDPSTVVEDKDKAMRLAQKKRQKAIWDHERNEEIAVERRRRLMFRRTHGR